MYATQTIHYITKWLHAVYLLRSSQLCIGNTAHKVRNFDFFVM